MRKLTLTNNKGYPAPLVRACEIDDYDYTEFASCTQLINPPRVQILKERHSSEIIEDADDVLWRLYGTGGHKALEQAQAMNCIPEVRWKIPVGDTFVTVKVDICEQITRGVKDRVAFRVEDYKFTSVFKAMKGLKHDAGTGGDYFNSYEAQANIGAYAYRMIGLNVEHVRVVIISRDWRPGEAKQKPKYPQSKVEMLDCKIWSDEEVLDFLTQRLHLYTVSSQQEDDGLPFCSAVERWVTEEYYQVVWDAPNDKGDDSTIGQAVKNGGWFATQEDAEKFKEKDDAARKKPRATKVKFTEGESKRCSYCEVKQFCNQWKETICKDKSEIDNTSIKPKRGLDRF